MDFDVLVIGGGAAGLMAAGTAAAYGAKVCLIEKNDKLGKKLFITGKGRCNVTNAAPISEFMSQIPGDGRFLFSAGPFPHRPSVAEYPVCLHQLCRCVSDIPAQSAVCPGLCGK